MIELVDNAGATPEMIFRPGELAYYADYPVEFVEDNILSCARAAGGQDSLSVTKQQADALKELAKYNRVGIESGHGCGKSTLFSWAGLWFVMTRYNPFGFKIKVPCIAPTFHQLYDVLWPEFKTWLPQSRLYPLFETRNEEIYLTGMKDSAFIRARSPKEPDNLQGFHAPHLLWICDEAFGIINDQCWEMIEGSATQADNKILFGGQHTVVMGYCHDAFHKDKADWRTLRFDSRESPICSPAFGERIARRYGKNSDVYRVRVLGQEPKGNPDAFIQMTTAEMAKSRSVVPMGALRMGLDCARFGDDLTVLTIAQGLHVFPQEILERSDTYDLYDLVVRNVRKYRKQTGYGGSIDCRIDATGGYGAGVYDMLLRNTEDHITPIAIDFGGAGNQEYADIVSAMWGSLREQIGELQLPDCDFLMEEIGTRRYELDKHGRTKIEPKSEYKKDYEGSPDRSDSLVLCLYTKTWRKRVWEFCNREVMVDMDIKWYDKKQAQYNLHYAALVMGSDMSVTVLCALWDQRRGYLYVYDGWKTQDPSPIALVPQMAARMHLRDFRMDRIIGNALLFEDKGTRPVVKGINDKLKEARLFEHRVKPATRHDFFGSIVDVGQMWKLKRIFVSKRLEDAMTEFQHWGVDKGEPLPGNSYCEALCMISGELKVVKELSRVLIPEFRDYTKKEKVEALYREIHKPEGGKR